MSTFSIPFRFNGLGQIEKTTDVKLVWRDRVRLVLATKFGERVMRPDFGSDLNHVLFEDEVTAVELATRTITIAFNTWLGALKLIEITPKYDDYTGTLVFTVVYTLPSGEEDSVRINTAIFNRTGDLIQEITRG